MIVMEKKSMMAVEIMVIIVLATIVLAVLVGVIILGGQQPTSDIAKQTFVRACCQLNMPLTCTNTDQVKCTVPDSLESTFGPSGIEKKVFLISAADKIGISGLGNVKTFCGC